MEHGDRCTCPQCGARIPDPPLDFAYRFPDCVFALPAEQRSPRCNQDFAELGERRFIRGLLPVPIAGGDEFRYGVWLEVDADTFVRVIQAWNDPAQYRGLAFVARLANALPPFGDRALDLVVEVTTRDETSRPFVTSAREPWLSDLLCRGWTQAEFEGLASNLRA